MRAACRKIIRGASRGLAIYQKLIDIETAAREQNEKVLPHPGFLNVQGLLWMFELEVACLLDDYIRSRDERRWLYARLLLLCLFEATKTLRGLLSRSYRLDLEEKLGAAYAGQLREMHGYIHHAHEDLNAEYGEVRRRLVAHKDPDANLRWQALSSVNGLEIKDFAWELLEWCAALAVLHKHYLSKIDELNGFKTTPSETR